MKVLLKSVKIVDPESKHHNKVRDILIQNGKIAEVSSKISSKGTKTISGKNLHVSPGWLDMRANFRDPGFEFKEDIGSGIKSAAIGGFTGVCCFPSTQPSINSKSAVEYVLNKSKNEVVDLYPIGAVTKDFDGKTLNEMYDMYLAGAPAFSDDFHSIVDAGVMSRALLYTKNFKGLIINYPVDKGIHGDGVVNEGVTSTSLGLKGSPNLAEEIMVARDIFLTEYTDARTHLSSISTEKSVNLIKDALKKGINISAEVSAHQIILDDTALNGFDSNFKTVRPLRTKKDNKALIKGLKDGTIEVICSDHCPQDKESKDLEFSIAEKGIIGLETAYAIANTVLSSQMDLEDLIKKFSQNPRRILGLEPVVIEKDRKANLTIFDPKLKWTLTENDLRSKSRNTPFIGTAFIGKALGVINNGKVELTPSIK